MISSVSGGQPQIPDQKTNQTVYNEGKDVKIYAKADTSTNQIIELGEAKAVSTNSIFTSKDADDKLIQDKLNNNSLDKNDEHTLSTIKKYLGNNSFSNIMNKVLQDFKNIDYGNFGIRGSSGLMGAGDGSQEEQLNNFINEKINSQLDGLTQKIQQNYSQALENAIKQAENELVGDKDILNENGEGITTKDNYEKLNDLMYKRPEDEKTKGEHTSVSTFNSSGKVEDENGNSTETNGYQKTVRYLEANGAKAKTKLVNGQEQTVYKVKVDGKTQYVTVDDAGQVHGLEKNKGFLRSSKFTTQDSIADAQEQLKNEGYQGGFNGKDVKVKVRNVDGQNQSVMTWEDDNGQKHSRVIDHDNQSGMTSSMDVNKVNAGGRAKYSSDVSGLGALADAVSGKDGTRFDNNRFINDGSVVHTQHGRMELDANNTGDAINNIIDKAVRTEKAVAHINGDITTIEFENGHTYTLDKNDNVGANRTMRLIQAEINNIVKEPVNTDKTIDVYFKYQDERTNANAMRTDYDKEINGGVNSNKVSNTGGKYAKVNYNRLGGGITPQAWKTEGWGSDKDRTKENEYLTKMATDDVRNAEGQDNHFYLKNITTAKDFTNRFVIAYKKMNNISESQKVDTNKLMNAIIAANPSLFKQDSGDMRADADFTKLNLPKKLDNYFE